MEKIRLKSWQKILLFSVAGLLILLVVLNVILNRPDNTKRLPVSVKMNIDLQPIDSTARVFYNEEVKGDSVRFETIGGENVGWIFQVFSVGQAIDYTLFIDFRQTDHVWTKGDSLIFTDKISGLKDNCPVGLLQIRLQSKLKMAENTFLTDNLDFSKYYLSLKCRRYDSLASFDGVFYAEEYLLNPEFYPDKLVLTGAFRADSIKTGRRIVN
ncbi:MAG: hypothetical protein AB7V36_01525 [Bacteroidales bacterium]|jgi:hypothetical protein|nr:hypothetical protein [Bacteroidales bacterium]